MSVASDLNNIGTFGAPGLLINTLPGLIQNTVSAGKAAVAGKNPVAAWFSQFDKSIANFTLIAIGVILAIGALLISQRKTIVKIGDTAAKGAAMLG